jgi:hypothetical protein
MLKSQALGLETAQAMTILKEQFKWLAEKMGAIVDDSSSPAKKR